MDQKEDQNFFMTRKMFLKNKLHLKIILVAFSCGSDPDYTGMFTKICVASVPGAINGS